MAQNDEIKDKVKAEAKSAAPGSNGDESIDEVPLFKKKRMIIPLLVLLTASAIGGYYWYMNMQNFVSTDDAFVDANSVAISSKMLGRITFLGAKEGDTVKTDQLLVKLDDSDLKAQEAAASASLSLMQNSIPLAQVNLNRAQDDFNRGQMEYKSGVITKEQLDHFQSALETAKAQLEIEKAKVPTAKSQIGVISSQINNTNIYSPMDGVVAKRWVLTGDVIQPGQPIYTVYDLKNIWISANLEETKLTHIRIGEPVEIDVDSYPDMKFHGKIFEIGNYTASEFSLIPPNNASGNFTKVTQRVPVKISIDDTANANGHKPVLRPGMSVEVTVRVK